jgi:hypothetical protein
VAVSVGEGMVGADEAIGEDKGKMYILRVCQYAIVVPRSPCVAPDINH